ncbi:MAG: nitroreductase family protein [Candidatus Brocadiales bacterium]
MSVLEIIKKRRSVRRFQGSREISKEIIDELIEALIWAPSAGNLQSRRFYFVRNQAVKDGLVKAAWGQGFIAEAPLVIVACADMHIGTYYGSRGTELYALQDVAASIQNLLLLAYEHGLATVWVGAFDEQDAAEALKLPGHLRPVAIVPVGYPAEEPFAPRRVSDKNAIEFID